MGLSDGYSHKTLDKKYLSEEAAAANESSEEDDISFDDLDLDNL